MAKATKRRPAPEKPIKTRKCVFCSKKGQTDRLQGHGAAAHLHQRARQDPCPSGDRQLRAAPARHRDRGQERPRGGAAAVQLVDALSRRTEDVEMKLILTAEVDHLGSAGDIVEVKDGYGRNFLLPRGLAIVASRGARAPGRRDPSGPRDQERAAAVEHANELKTAIEGLGPVELSVKDRGGHRQAVRFRDGGRRRRGDQEGRRTESGQADGPAAQGAHQDRSAPTRSRSGCTRTWTPRCP